MNLAYISPIIELAEPAAKLQTFIKEVRTVGSLLRDGFWTAEIVERELWDIARAHDLTDELEAEEYIGGEIDKAIAIDEDGPRANGHDEEPPPLTEIPESADANRDRAQRPQDKEIKTVNFRTLLEEQVIEEPDYIEPNFAGPGQFILIAGPPKAQKSLLLQEMLVSCAIGAAFLLNTFKVARPLRVFWLQAEMNRKLLRRRAHEFDDLTQA